MLILSGAADPIVPADNAPRLAALLTSAGAAVRHQTLPGGHDLSQADLATVKAWLERLPAEANKDVATCNSPVSII